MCCCSNIGGGHHDHSFLWSAKTIVQEVGQKGRGTLNEMARSLLQPDLPLRWCKSGGNLFSLRTLNSQSLSMASQLLEIPSL